MLLAAAALALGAWAEEPPPATGSVESANGLRVGEFRTAAGRVRVLLPDDLLAGDTISGTVLAEPAGENPEQQAASADQLEGLIVEVAEQPAPAAESRGKWQIPPAALAAIPVLLRDPSGRELARVLVPLGTPAVSPGVASGVAPAVSPGVTPGVAPGVQGSISKPAPTSFAAPAVAQAGKPIDLAGPFDGDATTTGILLNGREARVLAESPRRAIVQPPADLPPGPVKLELSENDRKVTCELHTVGVKLASPKTTLEKGEQTSVTVTVSGLGELGEAVSLRLVNRTPGAVRLSGGEQQELRLDPLKVNAAGALVLERGLTGIRSGNFSISAQIAGGERRECEQEPASSPEAVATSEGAAPDAPPVSEFALPAGDDPFGEFANEPSAAEPGGTSPTGPSPFDSEEGIRARREPPPGCARTTDRTAWGETNPVNPATPSQFWNDTVRCVQDGALFPFRGRDLARDERIYIGQWRHKAGLIGEQTWGYDIGAVRLVLDDSGRGSWDDWRAGSNPTARSNADSVVYGKPVYAMTAGTVVRCWRNAPENPSPDSLHPMLVARRISGSGNFIVIQEDDGDAVWYAHAQPGTIPSALCPNDLQYYPGVNDESSLRWQDSQAWVLRPQRVRVLAGDFLFRVGNSGQSSAPHLHVHKQVWAGDPMLAISLGFVGGRYQPVRTSLRPTLDESFWWSFAGEPVPPGPVVIWPE